LGVSLGIAAAVLSFAFQPVILSLLGWIYLVGARVYREGDRIRVGEIKGDVILIDPMHTKIMEIGGEYIKGDYTSGRVYTLPNSLVLTAPVANYTKYFPYIWTEISFQLTYGSDLKFAMENTKKITKQHFMKSLKKIGQKYEDFLEFHEFETESFQPIRFTVVPSQSWIDFRVVFPVMPKKKGVMISSLTNKILEFFNKHPEKIAFPKGRAR
jgi:small-conductance mechanosensitive channel